MTPLLELDKADVRRARALARKVGKPVVDIANKHTTVSVERATLRLAGLSGADHERVPWVNHLVDAVRESAGLEHGVTLPVWDALRRGLAPDLLTLAQMASSRSVEFRIPEGKDATAAAKQSRAAVARGIRAIDKQRVARERLVKRHGDPKQRPWIYLIVATGDIYEDIPQAQAAAREGADVIAVIRSTGQTSSTTCPRAQPVRGMPGRTPPRRTSGSCGPRSTRRARRSVATSD